MHGYSSKIAFPITVLLTGFLITADVLACGESLFRVGRGVAYREYSAPLPGKILVVAVTEGEQLMVERLAAAGHDMHVIEDPGQIGAALASQSFDIVMTYFADREVVSEETRGSDVRYLPVAREGTADESEALALNQYAPNSGDSVKSFLKSIHRTLKESAT